MSVSNTSQLDRLFFALADPTRRSILAKLRSGEASVLEISEPFDMSQPAISKHLKVLEDAGLISRHRRSKQRLCRLEARSLRPVCEWTGGFEQFWEDSFDRLDEYVQKMKAEGTRE